MQQRNNILIERQNLQSGLFTAYSEKKNSIQGNDEGWFSFQETSFDGLQFIHCDYQLVDEACICIAIENEALEMHFRLQGPGSIQRLNKTLDLPSGSTMLTLAEGKPQEACMHPSDKGHFYEIRIGTSHYEKLMSDFYPSAYGLFSGTPCSITPEMYALLSQLSNTSYSGKMKALFLEAKMTELFLLQLQQNRKPAIDKPFSFKTSDKDKFYNAKQLIEEHLDEFITISRLAQLVGVNQRKLMQGFKAIFGCTIYQYISDLKMQTAKSLLLDGNKNVNEVAYHIGYQNAQHFTAAFKKKFGILPSRLKG